ncbi:MAG TPA: glycosyltransferase [Acidobacteriaceae bacterium]|nr:glycosyltransferase [Acidobacteriaceae bacterium]
MHIVIFGLSISSSWGNGHATLWRALVKALLRRGHTVKFYEKDVPYYARERDLIALPKGGRLCLYSRFESISDEAQRDMDDADLAVCTSFCPDGPAASHLICNSRAAVRAFYDLDSPVTLDAFNHGSVAYLPPTGLESFDLVLSYTGGRALEELKHRLGAKRVEPLYGSVDPESHFPVPPSKEFRATLSYLGTYAEDRQERLERLFLSPARQLPSSRFLLGGAQYPNNFPWTENIAFVRHVPPPIHSAFFSSSRATLNITREAMARYGYCPSGRLFEAAACGAPLFTDWWEGLDQFFKPGLEVLPVQNTQQVIEALSLSDAELLAVATAARERTLAQHTGMNRVLELEQICESVRNGALQENCA